jgi:hypothetical protein
LPASFTDMRETKKVGNSSVRPLPKMLDKSLTLGYGRVDECRNSPSEDR